MSPLNCPYSKNIIEIMKKFTPEQIAQIVWGINPLKATENYPRCSYPHTKINHTTINKK